MTDGIVRVCCEYLYEEYTLQGISESHWPDLHQRIARLVNFEEWLNIKMEKERECIDGK